MKKRAQSPEQAITNLETVFFDKLRSLRSLGSEFANIRSALDNLGDQHDLQDTEAPRLEWLLSTVEIGLADILGNYEIEEALEKAAAKKSDELSIIVPFTETKRELADYTSSGDVPESEEEFTEAAYEYFHMTTKEFPGVEVKDAILDEIKGSRAKFGIVLSGKEGVLRNFVLDVLNIDSKEFDALEKDYGSGFGYSEPRVKTTKLPEMVVKSIVSSDDGVYGIILFEDGTRLYTGEEDRCVLVRPRDMNKDVYSGNKYVDSIDAWEYNYPIKERTMTKVEEIHFIMVYEDVSRQDAEAMVED